ncbi:MAG TPA: hypothetical protein PK280_14065 [Planctomycetota bacterium]|nr:hypothetical protein [Planctomycetota bacterium]
MDQLKSVEQRLTLIEAKLQKVLDILERRLVSGGSVPGSLPAMLSIRQVSELAGISAHTVRKACFKGALRRASRCAKGFRILDVLDWLDSRDQCPEEYRSYLQSARKFGALSVAGRR